MKIIRPPGETALTATDLRRGVLSARLDALLPAVRAVTKFDAVAVVLGDEQKKDREIAHVFGHVPDGPAFWGENVCVRAGGVNCSCMGQLRFVNLPVERRPDCPLRTRFAFANSVWGLPIVVQGVVAAQLMLFDRATGRELDSAQSRAVAALNDAIAAEIFAAALHTENRAKARLEETVGTFLRLMSHELRTPLNAALGFTELARTQLGHGQPASRILDSLNHALLGGEQLRILIDQLLVLAAVETGETTLDLAPQSVVNLFEGVARRNFSNPGQVKPQVEIRGGQLAVNGDAKALAWVLDELVRDALGTHHADSLRLGAMRVSISVAALWVEHDSPLDSLIAARHIAFREVLGAASDVALPPLALRLPVVQRVLARMQGDLVEQVDENGRRRLIVRLPIPTPCSLAVTDPGERFATACE